MWIASSLPSHRSLDLHVWQRHQYGSEQRSRGGEETCCLFGVRRALRNIRKLCRCSWCSWFMVKRKPLILTLANQLLNINLSHTDTKQMWSQDRLCCRRWGRRSKEWKKDKYLTQVKRHQSVMSRHVFVFYEDFFYTTWGVYYTKIRLSNKSWHLLPVIFHTAALHLNQTSTFSVVTTW